MSEKKKEDNSGLRKRPLCSTDLHEGKEKKRNINQRPPGARPKKPS